MNFDNFFEFTVYVTSNNTVQIIVHEFLEDATLFQPRTNVLVKCTSTQIAHEYSYFEVDGQRFDRISYYKNFAHYTYRYKIHVYEIAVASDFDINNKDSLAAEYIQLAKKYHITPDYTDSDTYKYNGIKDPQPLSKVETIKADAIQRFNQSLTSLTNTKA